MGGCDGEFFCYRHLSMQNWNEFEQSTRRYTYAPNMETYMTI